MVQFYEMVIYQPIHIYYNIGQLITYYNDTMQH
ncbi:hypothetical protein O166_19695 [Pseudogulbenkiania ferrooxidans EGD-HP2]|uniref:Uncharacterized protein n=1 Tax=Pseudogulbenkiania ferrooxidans EGD-HP2 TaxID=1388764 RepID=A0ABP2XRW3_9NEIS|nr:hypothetical protein O166_19695 [Pseudogulbenkiania ferrooxidans EGD-HP2]